MNWKEWFLAGLIGMSVSLTIFYATLVVVNILDMVGVISN